MNLDSLSLALSQISYLVDNLTKKNYRASQQEIQHIVNRHGPEADRHLLRCLFSHVDFSGDGKSSGKDFHQTQFLIQECASLITKPNFISTLSYAIDNPLHYQKSLKPSPHLFAQLSKVIKLSKVQEVIFGLALLNSFSSDLRGFAAQFIKQKLPDLLRSYIDADVSGNQEGGFQDIAIEVLHLLLSHLLFGQKGAFGVGQEQIDAFLKTLRRDFPQERCPVVLAPLLYPEKRDILMDRILPDSGGIAKTMMESSLADFMQEVGYGFCTSVEECRNIIMQFGVREVTAAQVARVLGMMARTHSGLTDGIPLQSISAPGSGIWSDGKDKSDGAQAHTWNVEVLIDVLKELNPSLDFKVVTYELDHPGFQIRDSKGLHIVVFGIQRGLGMEVFPVNAIYRPWKHAEGQLSFIQHSLINPDIFCFADYPCHTVTTDILKAPPEDDNREIATCLDLIESLLRLAEVGQYEQVKQLFSFPIKHCPDMLVLALLQINTSWHTLRHELISTLMPIFLGNHPNSAIILHYAWHGQGQSPSIRQLIMHAMAEWYMRGEQYDQAKLSRILDVAQDLKALSMLLNGTPFAFVIDLAALASRREYLKLDKWLTDKIREHGEPFIQACMTFLKRRCPSILGGLAPEKDQPKSAQLPPETLATMLACLQACAGSVSQELSETILTMVANCSNVMNKARQPPPGVMPKGRPPSASSLDAISPVQIDSLAGMASLSLGGSAAPHTQSMQGFPPNLGSAFSTPQSPAKAFPPLSTQNQTTGFSGIGGLSSQLPVGGLTTGSLTGIGTGALGLPAVNNDPFVQRKLSTSGLSQPTFQQSKMKPSDLSQVWPEANQNFSKEIDDEANSYFQRIYNHPPHPTMSVDEVLEMLQRFKDSNIKREREVFNCMLRNLFEEYRFFPQYPDKELHITACLFGGIIEKGLVTYMALGLALRYVLEALRKPFASKMYYFGIAALDRFKNRLKDYPQYCQHLASISHFIQFPHHLQEYIEYGQQSRDPPVKMQGSITTPGSIALAQAQAQAQVPAKAPLAGQVSTIVTTSTTTTVAKTITITRPTGVSFKKDVPPSINTTNIDTLLVATDQTERIVEPPENVQEKIAFIFNNLSQSNMTQKVEELKETVKEEFMPWVSQYLVMKRVSIEPNFHSLYSNFLDTLKNPEFNKMVLNETYRNIKVSSTKVCCSQAIDSYAADLQKWSILEKSILAASPQQRDMMEQAAAQLAQDNCELACCFIQKTAVEKAGPEMDKRLATEFELRKHARQEGRRYCDPVVLTYQAERMPEQIRLKVGGVDPKQLAVYEEFARNVPGFLPTNDLTQPTGFLAQPMKQAWATDDVAQIYDKCMTELEQHLQSIPHTLAMNPQAQALRSLLEAVVVARNSRDAIAALGLLQKAVEGLLDATSGADADLLLRYRECHLLVLKALQDGRAYGSPWCNKQITRCLIECRDEYKYNVEAVELLIRNHLVNMQQYDLHLAQSMENGLNYMAVAFAMQLVKILLVDERSVAHVTEADLFHTIETLMRINAHSRGNAPEGLPQLMEVVRSNYEAMIDRAHGGPNFMMHSGISQASEYDDPPGLREKAEYLLREWVNLYHSAAAGRDSTKAFSAFVGQVELLERKMHQQGILKTDDLITRFFRLCTEMCVEISYRAQAEQQHNPAANPTMIRAKCYHNLDAFVRLIALLVKHSGEATNTVTKINLLNKVLGIVVGVLLQDHEVRQGEFQQLPYHRIFIMLLLELNAPEHVLETINFQTLTAFCNTFHILRPTKAPGFVYAWLELISHRIFIARMLAHTPQQKGWPMYAQLLIDLFKYLAPFLRNVELTKPMQILYKGTLRVLLVLLHDFPEFLCDYHYGFCDVIPPNCIQLRNLILSAFPRNMRLPDPFTPNLKVDMLSEINIAPRILTNFTGVMPPQFKKDLDSYLKTRSPVTFLSDLRSNLQVSNEPGNRYNIQLINALVLYVGTQAIAHIHNKGSTPSMSTITHSAHMDIFQNLAVDLDTEGRYLFLNAIANQLRYPNSHTHYFSCTMLYLFAEANTEAIQEQITRVLLERLIVNRPHPWGLLITFIELIKNPAFKFWNHEFVHCAPEIEKLFQSVAQCCMGQKQAQQVMEGTGAS
uniref:CCR4-NOT transcription complex subunit 1 n=1 Tax=Chrysolophus pictus TaxID=9089 RepID=A0A8C3LFY7_CHRPC